jgi:hypothetical protein
VAAVVAPPTLAGFTNLYTTEKRLKQSLANVSVIVS